MDKQKKAYFNLLLTFLVVVAFIVYGLVFPNLSPVYIPHNTFPGIHDATLIIEPDQSDAPIVAGIKSANKSIDLEVYLLSDEPVIQSLIDAEKRGVQVRVILEKNPYKGYGANKETKDKLSHYGIQTKWSNKVYRFTHSKFLVIDNRTGYILTMNLTKSSFSKNREFGIITHSKNEVENLEEIFQSDWDRKPYHPNDNALVVSPENSRQKLTELINSAKYNILVYAEEMEDQSIENLLVKKARDGVDVNVILASPEVISANGDAGKYLSLNGVKVGFLSSPFVHAKIIVVDNSVSYVGSINFSSTSLDENREVGVIVADEKVSNTIAETFYEDFKNCSKSY